MNTEQQTPQRVPTIHPGMPGSYSLRVKLRIINVTLKAYLVEWPTDPRGKVWIPRSITGTVSYAGKGAVANVHLPAWFYRKIQPQL